MLLIALQSGHTCSIIIGLMLTTFPKVIYNYLLTTKMYLNYAMRVVIQGQWQGQGHTTWPRS